ncbi:hypothetical protein Tco_0631504 [Tanacetum coccineum]
MRVVVAAPTKVSDDGFVEVTRKHGNGKQTAKTRHIDGVRLTKPKPNYYYRPISKSANNTFDALMEKDKFFEVKNETWKASNDVGSIMDDSDSEEVKNVFVEDNGKPMDGMVDDAHKKAKTPPKKTLRKIGSGVGRGVKEKQVSLSDKSAEVSKHVSVANTGSESFPTVFKAHGIPSPTNEANMNNVGTTAIPTMVGNTPGMSSYANITGEPSRKALNFHILFTPGGNGVDVVVPVESIRAISERFANTAYGFFLGKRVAYPVVANYVKLYGVPVTVFSKDGLSAIATKIGTPLMLDSYTSDMCLQSWGMSSYARAMIELRADVELKDTIVVAMPKLTGEEFYTCLGVAKNLKKPSQAPKGVPVGSKVGFKPLKQAYRPVSTKPTANTSGNKKNDVEPTKMISNLNPFDVLTSVENDMDLGTNGGLQICTNTTPIVEKIGKIEKLIIDGKVTLVDDKGEPVKKVDYSGDHDSEDEVASVDNDMAHSMASEKVGFSTKSLLEQRRDTYENDDYDYDPYDDDMYEGQEIPDKIQGLCDNLDIKVRGRKKK